MNASTKLKGIIGTTWAIVGLTLLLGTAFYRLTPHIIDAFQTAIEPLQWAVLVLWTVYMLVTEGYQGFQKRFSPRFAARAWHLYNHGRTIDILLAPLYAAGFYAATRKRMIVSWVLIIGIIVLIIIVSQLPTPWRGIIDVGVVTGLAYGLVSTYYFTWKTFSKGTHLVDPEIPGFTLTPSQTQK